MVDKLVPERKRAEEYSVLASRVVKAIQDRLRQKGLTQDNGKVNPDNISSHNFELSTNYETGLTTFELSFAGAFKEGDMRYVFKDGKVRKEGHSYVDGGLHSGERYYGEFTQDAEDFICGVDANDPNSLPRDDIFFHDPLPVNLRELKMVSQIVDLIGANPKKADKLARKLTWFEELLI